MAGKLLLSLAALASAVSLVAGDTCSIISSTTAIEVDGPLSLDYAHERTQYWSTACTALLPTCILSPTTAQEVATIVRALRAQVNTDKFAIKSGGHSPNKFFASVDGGALITTRLLNEVNLDAAAQTVRVGPGNRWVDVANALDGSGFTAVGGRIGDVGVGGLLMYGGLSFLSPQEGWAMNAILEYEIVLANGTIATASKDENADLFYALKGSGNQLGIVTSFLLKAHPIENQIYGGLFVFTPDKQAQVLAAVRDFTANYDSHPKAAIISTTVIALNLVESWVMFVFYDGPDPGTTFQPFLNIGPISNTAKQQSYASFLASNNFAAIKGFTYLMGTETLPLPSQANGVILNEYLNYWRTTAQNVFLAAGIMPSIAYQPVPKRQLRIAEQAGGDLLAMDKDSDFIVFELNISYVNLPIGWDDAKVNAKMDELVAGLKTIVDGHVAQGKVADVHRPLFANDGHQSQDYWGRLRAQKRAFAEGVRDSVDPDGFWAGSRTGGFKL